ncbi:hypothetical protein A5746_02050 [Mycolicibacterium conceptionense]|nr:hypothetical protein A5746_02050 [Mycolicibacterium conceptionense]
MQSSKFQRPEQRDRFRQSHAGAQVRTIIIVKLFDSMPHYGGPAQAAESSFGFLNRADGEAWQNVRSLLESWYLDYPDRNGDLRARFRQDDERQHLAAWWELYIFVLFRQLGYQVDVHPEVEGTSKRPDFRVANDSRTFYVECTTMIDYDEWTDSDHGAWVLDCINSVENPDFMVDLTLDQAGTQRPRSREIKIPIQAWLATLDWANMSAELSADREPPTATFQFRDWVITLAAWPVLADHRGEPGRLVGTYLVGDDQPREDGERIRKVLAKKGSRYTEQAQPLVLALLTSSSFVDERDVTSALFGSVAIRYFQGGKGNPPPTWIRLQNGYWRPRSERGSRVSGVLFANHLHKPWNPVADLPLMYLNPWAARLLAPVPPFGARTTDDNGRLESTSPTRTAAEVLGTSGNLFDA